MTLKIVQIHKLASKKDSYTFIVQDSFPLLDLFEITGIFLLDFVHDAKSMSLFRVTEATEYHEVFVKVVRLDLLL